MRIFLTSISFLVHWVVNECLQHPVPLGISAGIIGLFVLVAGIARWRILEKLDQPGWLALIPFWRHRALLEAAVDAKRGRMTLEISLLLWAATSIPYFMDAMENPVLIAADLLVILLLLVLFHGMSVIWHCALVETFELDPVWYWIGTACPWLLECKIGFFVRSDRQPDPISYDSNWFGAMSIPPNTPDTAIWNPYAVLPTNLDSNIPTEAGMNPNFPPSWPESGTGTEF